MQTHEELVTDLVYKAESGKHRQFQLLLNWQEYRYTRKLRRSHALLVTSIDKSAKRLLKRYCKDIVAGKSDVIKLMAYYTTIKVLRYYKEELRLLTEMIDEYEAYLLSGNFMDFIGACLLFEERPKDKLWDHRG